MIKQGKNGSYNIFYKGLFMSSFPIHYNKLIEGYNNEGIDLIERSLRENYNLKSQIKNNPKEKLKINSKMRINHKNLQKWRNKIRIGPGCTDIS